MSSDSLMRAIWVSCLLVGAAFTAVGWVSFALGERLWPALVDTVLWAVCVALVVFAERERRRLRREIARRR